MDRIAVKSSFVKSIGYDEEDCILEIEFVHGSIHQYSDVELERYLSFMKSTSIGKYYLKYIKDKYNFTRVTNRSAEV